MKRGRELASELASLPCLSGFLACQWPSYVWKETRLYSPDTFCYFISPVIAVSFGPTDVIMHALLYASDVAMLNKSVWGCLCCQNCHSHVMLFNLPAWQNFTPVSLWNNNGVFHPSVMGITESNIEPVRNKISHEWCVKCNHHGNTPKEWVMWYEPRHLIYLQVLDRIVVSLSIA